MNQRLLAMLIGRMYRKPDGGDGAGSGAGGGGGDGGAGGSGSGADGKGADGAGSAGAGAGAGAAGAGADGKAGDGKGAEKSLLEELGKGGAAGDGKSGAAAGAGDDKKGELTPEAKALAAAEKDTRRPKSVPAKYWDAEKGEVNYDAWAKSTTELETRMRTVGLPPKSADEYKAEVPKELKDAGVDLDPAQAKGFRDMAHSLGLTQKQYEGVMGSYFKSIAATADQVSQFSQANARTELLGFYKTEEAMTANVKNAFKVFEAFASPEDFAQINKIGNIPAVIRTLAKIWPEMQEDPGVNPDAILDGDSLDQLMRGGPGKEDSPYWNPSDPRHKATLAKVTRHHEATTAAARRKAA